VRQLSLPGLYYPARVDALKCGENIIGRAALAQFSTRRRRKDELTTAENEPGEQQRVGEKTGRMIGEGVASGRKVGASVRGIRN